MRGSSELRVAEVQALKEKLAGFRDEMEKETSMTGFRPTPAPDRDEARVR